MDTPEQALAQALRQHSEALSKMLPQLNTFWSGRIEKLIQTSLAWIDQLEAKP